MRARRVYCHGGDTTGFGTGPPVMECQWGACYSIPEGTAIVDFADDLAVVVTAIHPVEVHAVEIARAAKSWLNESECHQRTRKW